MTKALQFNLLLTIFLIPIITPFQSFGYEKSKILFFIFLTSLSGFLWIWLLHQQKIKLRWSAIKIISLIFIMILLLTSFLGIDPISGLVGKEPYFQGWIVYSYLWLFSLMIATVRIEPKKWIIALSLSSVIVSLVAIRQFVEISFLSRYIPTYAGRVVSTFGQPNFYSGFILFTLPFFHFLLVKKPVKWWAVVGFLISIVAIVLSQSRTAYFLLSGLMSVWLIGELRGKRRLISGLVLATVILAMTLSVFLSSKPRFVFNPDLTKESVENRFYIWPVSWQLILQKSFLGYGLENIAAVFTNYFKENKHALFEENLKVSPVLISLKELNIDRSHNYILDLLLFSGIIGLLGYIGLIGVMFKKIKSKILLISLIIYLVWVQFQNQSIVHLLYFWLLVGLVDKDGT